MHARLLIITITDVLITISRKLLGNSPRAPTASHPLLDHFPSCVTFLVGIICTACHPPSHHSYYRLISAQPHFSPSVALNDGTILTATRCHNEHNNANPRLAGRSIENHIDDRPFVHFVEIISYR